MDFTSFKTNAIYGPLRILLGALLTIAVTRGWIPAWIISQDTLDALAVCGVAILLLWSAWEANHKAKKADLVTKVAVNNTVAAMQGSSIQSVVTSADLKGIVEDAKLTVKTTHEADITAALNRSQLGSGQ